MKCFMWSRSSDKRYASTYLNDTAMNKFLESFYEPNVHNTKTAEFAAENFCTVITTYNEFCNRL